MRGRAFPDNVSTRTIVVAEGDPLGSSIATAIVRATTRALSGRGGNNRGNFPARFAGDLGPVQRFKPATIAPNAGNVRPGPVPRLPGSTDKFGLGSLINVGRM